MLRLILAGIASFLIAVGPCWAGEAVPVPPRKPGTERHASVINYSLKDFAKAIFGSSDAEPEKISLKTPQGYDGPLSKDDARLYAAVFRLQDEGRMGEAEQEMAKVQDWRLRGHVLFQRYMHPTAYNSRYEELRDWLAAYNDHPGADKIYGLAVRKNGGSAQGLKKPQAARGVSPSHEPMMVAARTYKSMRDRSPAEEDAVKSFRRTISTMVSKGETGAALKKLQSDKTARLLDDAEYDTLQARIAAGYLYRGKTAEALKLAAKSAKRSGEDVPDAGWIAGLVSWHGGHYRRAARYFEMTASSPYASSWSVSAGAYWAARSHMRAGNVRAVSKWLNTAVEHPRTFYGLVATRALGQDFEFNWKIPAFTDEYRDRLGATPAGQRALALADAGRADLAEAELARINPKGSAAMREAMLSYAAHAGLPALAMRVGASGSGGVYYDAALYPMGPWVPREGFKVDPALINAIMRQESKFDPGALSPSGARGLMQLMPGTAKSVARRHGGGGEITDPQTNVGLGQRYIADLLKDKYVENDLLSLLIAYNAGPGNLARWKKNWPDVTDPLLFIELIPSSETRAYVERVLANYWIYRLREDLPTPSLEALAAGKPARYAGLEAAPRAYRVAANTR